MKTCSKCKLTLSLEEFGKKNSKHQPYCRECNRQHSRAYYAANREAQKKKILERNKRYRKELRDLIISIKEGTPCMDCKVVYPWYVMDFDHVFGEKYMEISLMVSNLNSKKKILEEIDKCELVCSNCHRERTFKELASEAEEVLL